MVKIRVRQQMQRSLVAQHPPPPSSGFAPGDEAGLSCCGPGPQQESRDGAPGEASELSPCLALTAAADSKIEKLRSGRDPGEDDRAGGGGEDMLLRFFLFITFSRPRASRKKWQDNLDHTLSSCPFFFFFFPPSRYQSRLNK